MDCTCYILHIPLYSNENTSFYMRHSMTPPPYYYHTLNMCTLNVNRYFVCVYVAHLLSQCQSLLLFLFLMFLCCYKIECRKKNNLLIYTTYNISTYIDSFIHTLSYITFVSIQKIYINIFIVGTYLDGIRKVLWHHIV